MYVQIECLSQGSCKLTKSVLRNGDGGEGGGGEEENDMQVRIILLKGKTL